MGTTDWVFLEDHEKSLESWNTQEFWKDLVGFQESPFQKFLAEF